MTQLRGSFVARFRSVAVERVARVRAALETGDVEEARREMHGLKGEARVVGFEAIANVAHRLEELLEGDGADPRIERGLALIEEALPNDPDAALPIDEVFAAPGHADPSATASRQAVLPLERVRARVADAFVRADPEVLASLVRSVAELQATHRELSALIDELRAVEAEDDPARAMRGVRRALGNARRIAFEHRRRADDVAADVRRLRMVPLSEVFEPFPRAVAQLAAQLGKEVDVRMSGVDVEIDREVLDVVTEPLLHLVRNAVDHGLEPPEERRARGKPPRGCLSLDARASGGVAHIEVADDGGGVDLDAVRAAAGTGELDDEALLDALCRHGLSTRAVVTDVSGRGVGLDVVKRRVGSVGGRLSMSTERGRGTRFVIELPTSMVLGAMVAVEVDGARYAFAPREVVEVVDASSHPIGSAGDGRALRIGERTVPLVDLGALTGGADRPRERAVVLERGARAIAVAVDRFLGTSAVSEQRLDPFLDELEVVRSVAVLANGALAVVLDVGELMRRAERAEPRPPPAPAAATERERRVLVVDDSELTRDVLVATLREMGLEVVEAVNGEAALAQLERHRVRLVITDLDMPVLDGFELLRRVRAAPAHARLPIVVLSTRGSETDKARAATLGADAYLVKGGLDLEQLRHIVRRYAGASA